jgi:transposase
MSAEIISTVERRRAWPPEEKLRIMSAALEPGVTISSIADRNGICRSQLYTWLRLAREGRLAGIGVSKARDPTFVPVHLAASANPSAPRPLIPPSRSRGQVEIALCNGRTMRVDDGIDPAILARLVSTLEGETS